MISGDFRPPGQGLVGRPGPDFGPAGRMFDCSGRDFGPTGLLGRCCAPDRADLGPHSGPSDPSKSCSRLGGSKIFVKTRFCLQDALRTPFGAHFRRLWASLRPLLGATLGRLGLSRVVLEALPGTLEGPPGSLRGRLGPRPLSGPVMGARWGRLGANLRAFGANLGPLWGQLKGNFGAFLRPISASSRGACCMSARLLPRLPLFAFRTASQDRTCWPGPLCWQIHLLCVLGVNSCAGRSATQDKTCWQEPLCVQTHMLRD